MVGVPVSQYACSDLRCVPSAEPGATQIAQVWVADRGDRNAIAAIDSAVAIGLRLARSPHHALIPIASDPLTHVAQVSIAHSGTRRSPHDRGSSTCSRTETARRAASAVISIADRSNQQVEHRRGSVPTYGGRILFATSSTCRPYADFASAGQLA